MPHRPLKMTISKTPITEEPDRATFVINVADLGPVAGYTSILDVPEPLRANIRAAAAKGVPQPELARIFGMPDEWVRWFCSDAHNR